MISHEFHYEGFFYNFYLLTHDSAHYAILMEATADFLAREFEFQCSAKKKGLNAAASQLNTQNTANL